MRYMFAMILFVTALGILPTSAQESWIPYTANAHETLNRVDPATGQHTIISSSGIMARQSDGSSIEEFYQPGTTTPEKARLILSPEGTNYMLDFDRKIAIGRSMKLGHFNNPTSPVIGYARVGGVPATGYVLYAGPPGSAARQDNSLQGQFWVADGTDIIVRVTNPLPGGGTYEWELSDVKIGQAPPASLFVIPPGMQVSKPQAQPSH